VKLVINLEWLIEKLSTNDNLTLARSIIKFFKDGDGFSYVYKTKDDHKIGTTSYLFWCNCHQELARRPSKIVDEFKKHNTANHLVQYDCKGLAGVNLYCINGVEVKN